MRQIVLDTETTGLEPELGHRIIELGCVELVNRRKTRRSYHRYLRPDRDIEAGALAVHGIDLEFLAEQPRFGEVVDEFLEFVQGAELIIHNADFDIAFLNYELSLLEGDARDIRQSCRVLDTLALARRMHPGQRNSLDALCKRYQIDSSQRDLHGALLDAQLLADVYLAMTGGQVALSLEGTRDNTDLNEPIATPVDRDNLSLVVLRASAAESMAHEALLRSIDELSGGRCLWIPDASSSDDQSTAMSPESTSADSVESMALSSQT